MSRDVIGYMSIQFAICHFLLVSLWNRGSICNQFLAHDSFIAYMHSALYAIARPSVCHTGGSVKNGLS